MNFAEIARRLAAWQDGRQRHLPWRTMPAGNRDAYAVWVSEIMAQQTRLDTVSGYYTRWMERFPTLEALAAADQQDVLKAWEGLGYYARARNLHRAAQIVADVYAGELPRTRKELLKLPGIGEYSAGAILSIAFGLAEPILDGNVKRVFSRLADLDSPIEERATLKALWQMAQALVDASAEGQAGMVNEALMELGATVCTPSSPRCLACPLHDLCLSAANGTQNARPVTTPRPKTPHYDVTAGVIWRDKPYASPLLIAQRPTGGMLGGLWEFPGGKLEAHDEDLRACLRREIAEELAVEIDVLDPLTTVRHTYTHFRITLHAFHARWVAGEPQAIGCAGWQWVDLEQLAAFPFPVTDQKIIRALSQEDGPRPS